MWFYLAFLSAFTNGIATVARRTHGSTARPVELAWWTSLLTLPFCIALLLYTGQPYWTSYQFLLPATASAILSSFCIVLLFEAYKRDEASLISPLANLTPIGVVAVAYLFFGNQPAVGGLIGIGLTMMGIYYSSVSGKHQLSHPFKAVWQRRGARAMLTTVLIYSLTVNLDKVALRSSSAAFLLFFVSSLNLLLLSFYRLGRPNRRSERVLKCWWRHIFAVAGFTALSMFFQFKAVALTNPSYVLAVKRLDVLFVVLIAGLFLGERHLLKRLAGSAVAIVGVAILYFYK